MTNIKSIETLEAIDIIRRGGVIALINNIDESDSCVLYVASQFIKPSIIDMMAKFTTNDIKLTVDSKLHDSKNHKFINDINILIKDSIKHSTQSKYSDVTKVSVADGGVLINFAINEASVDISRLAGLYPSGVVSEIECDGGIEKLSSEFDIKVFDISKLREYRDVYDSILSETTLKPIVTNYGEFSVVGFHNNIDGQEAVAILKGNVHGKDKVLTRIHSQCITGDVFASMRCDCGEQLHTAMRKIHDEGIGMVIYLFQEGRGIGLLNKIKAYKLQDEGFDTVEANIHLGFVDDLRDYGFAGQVIRKLGVKNIKLLSNNPRKFDGLVSAGINIDSRVSIECGIHDENMKYMQTKKDKLGHKLNL